MNHRDFGTEASEEIRFLKKILRPDFESTVTLGSELTGLDEQLLQLTNDQIRVSRRMAGNPHGLFDMQTMDALSAHVKPQMRFICVPNRNAFSCFTGADAASI